METTKNSLKSKLTNRAWDAFCISSIIGIWPRYIEPRLLDTSHLHFDFPHLSFDKIKILHFSDLHLNNATSLRFLKKVVTQKKKFNPDFTFFTGDFFCRNEFIRKDLLIRFLKEMQGTFGSYCCFGNHDYDPYLTFCDGQITTKTKRTPPVVTGFKKFFKTENIIVNPPLDPSINPKVATSILDLLEKTPFTPLHNSNVVIENSKFPMHLVGVGDYWSNHFKPEAHLFKKSADKIGITLSHNPDSFLDLKKYPIDLILSGHTHGRQVNLPFIGRKLTPMINSLWARGLYKEGSTSMYVNRGLGGQTQFRWFSKPECTLITLKGSKAL